MKRNRILSLGLCAALLFASMPLLPSARTAAAEEVQGQELDASAEAITTTYQDMADTYAEMEYLPAQADDIVLPAANGKANSDIVLTETAGKQNVLQWNDKNLQWVEWSFEIETAGLYQIEIDYWLSEENTAHSVRGFEIDGKTPFQEAENLTFYQMFTDKNEPTKNVFGDEISPSQKPVPDWRTLKLCDSLGLYDMPYQFYFEQGTHTFRLNYSARELWISEIRICTAEEVPSYSDVLQSYQENGYTESTSSFRSGKQYRIQKQSGNPDAE